MQSIVMKPINSFTCMMAGSKPTIEVYKSKWEVNKIIEFQENYKAVTSKSLILKLLAKENKPSLND